MNKAAIIPDGGFSRAGDASKEVLSMSKILDMLAAISTVGMFFITFFDSYEVRFRIQRRARTVRDYERRKRRKR